MWRDRTNLFISYRQSSAHHPIKRNRYAASNFPAGYSDAPFASGSAQAEDHQGLLSGNPYDQDGDAVIEMDMLPPRWIDISDEIAELLDGIHAKGQQLEKLHQKHVLPGFNDEDTKRAEERDIEKLTQEITKGFHDCHNQIQRIQQTLQESNHQGTLTLAEESMAKNLQVSLATRVQDASAVFRKRQSAYLKKLRGMSGLNGSLSNDDRSTDAQTTSYADPSLQESDADRTFSQSTLQSTAQQRMLHSNNAVILQREREIEDIAQGIIDLSDLFRDLQTMVIDQGTMLDRIDYNVERMNTDVKSADKEIKVASGYQRKTTKRKIILLLILLIAGLFILLLVKPSKD